MTHQRAKKVIYSKEMAGIPNFWRFFATKVIKSHVKLHVKPDAMCEMCTRRGHQAICQQIKIGPMMLSDPSAQTHLNSPQSPSQRPRSFWSATGNETEFAGRKIIFLRRRSLLIEAPKWNLRRKNLKTGDSVIKYFSRKGEFIPIFSCFVLFLLYPWLSK